MMRFAAGEEEWAPGLMVRSFLPAQGLFKTDRRGRRTVDDDVWRWWKCKLRFMRKKASDKGERIKMLLRSRGGGQGGRVSMHVDYNHRAPTSPCASQLRLEDP